MYAKISPSPLPSRGYGAFAFAATFLVVGMAPIPLALLLAPGGDLTRTAPGLGVPPAAFGAVWTLLYPLMGIATWRVWSRRAEPGALEALAVSALSVLVLVSFLPITAAAHDQRVTAMMDVLALIGGYVAAWAYRRIDRTTTFWLAPLLVWLPVTTLLKVATLG